MTTPQLDVKKTGKFRFKETELDGIDGPYLDIVKIRDPVQMIDLLCVSHYFAGQFGNNIPVQEARTAFLAWLSKHDSEIIVDKNIAGEKP